MRSISCAGFQLESREAVDHIQRFLPKIADIGRCLLHLKRSVDSYRVIHSRGRQVGCFSKALSFMSIWLSVPPSQDWLKLASTFDNALKITSVLVVLRKIHSDR